MRALMVVYEGFAEYEYQLAALALYHNGIPFDTVSRAGREVTGMMGLRTGALRPLEEVRHDVYAGLVLPGLANGILRPNGEITPVDQEVVFSDVRLHRLIRAFDRDRRVLAAVCSAPAMLASAGVLEGRRFVSSVADRAIFRGATAVGGPAVRDGHIITGLGSRPYHFCALLVESLAGAAAAAAYREFAGLPVC